MVPRDVACPDCGAPPGYPCIARSGREVSTVHAVRRARADGLVRLADELARGELAPPEEVQA